MTGEVSHEGHDFPPGTTALEAARIAGHSDVATLLERWSPLHAAAARGDLATVRVLVEDAAALDTADLAPRVTPLWAASAMGRLDVVRVLLDARLWSCSADGRVGSPLWVASRNEVVRELLDRPVQSTSWLDAAYANGATPLSIACSEGHEVVVLDLLSHGASVDIPSSTGWTPLCSACGEGCLRAVGALLKHGAAITARTANGSSPLWIAAWNGHLDVVRELAVRGATINAANRFGWTPLHTASREGNVDVALELLARGASVEVLTKDGVSPLWLAAHFGHVRIVRALAALGASVDRLGKDGSSPLRGAVIRNDADTATELLRLGAQLLPELTEREKDKVESPLALVLAKRDLWLGDGRTQGAVDGLKMPFGRSSRRMLAEELVTLRRLRDELRPLVDPRAKAQRAQAFGDSPLGRLPWHLRVTVLSYVVLVPVRQEWGRQEFET